MTSCPRVNLEGTGYEIDSAAYFGRTFLAAMSFHAPEGLAAVRDSSGAYHIASSGEPAYASRFLETFGFYEGAATVRDRRGWFHIRPDGSPLHQRRLRWSGNFQDGRCAVMDQRGFFHIDAQGRDAYGHRFTYAGDFRSGIAVARGARGAFHIRADGTPLNRDFYAHADPFHKGVAVVADERGFYHVGHDGKPVHSMRFMSAEPFYNNVALCRTLDGDLIRLRANGTWTRVACDIEPVRLDRLAGAHFEGARVGLFVRHAERHPITPESPDWGNGVLLTERGIADAEALGWQLRDCGRLAIWSSPVERCVQTSAAIARGAGRPSTEARTHRHLGDPGIYFDGTGAHEEQMRRDFHAFADAYLDSGVAPGMHPVPKASEELLSFVLARMQEADCTVFVTHDFFAAALMSFLGLKAPDRDSWCEYLEGVCVLDRETGPSYFRLLGANGSSPC